MQQYKGKVHEAAEKYMREQAQFISSDQLDSEVINN